MDFQRKEIVVGQVSDRPILLRAQRSKSEVIISNLWGSDQGLDYTFVIWW